MKKYLGIALIIAAGAFVACFFLYKARPARINQESNTPEILFIKAAANNTKFKVCTICIDGKNLKELLTVNNPLNGNPIYIGFIQNTWVATTDQTTIKYIKNNLGKFKDAFTHPIYAFSRNFYAYSTPIEERDDIIAAGCYKGVFLCNTETDKTVQIDKDLTNKIPASSFSKDGKLFITSISFSHDGKFLFVTSLSNYLSVFSIEQMKFVGVFNMTTNNTSIGRINSVDMVQNKLYFVGGYDYSNVYEFDMDKKEIKPLTNCQQASFAISPDNKELVFIEMGINGKFKLGTLDLTNGTIKKIEYPEGGEIAGFVQDSKHLIVERYYKLSGADTKSHTAIYLINLNTLKETKIYAEDAGNG